MALSRIAFRARIVREARPPRVRSFVGTLLVYAGGGEEFLPGVAGAWPPGVLLPGVAGAWTPGVLLPEVAGAWTPGVLNSAMFDVALHDGPCPRCRKVQRWRVQYHHGRCRVNERIPGETIWWCDPPGRPTDPHDQGTNTGGLVAVPGEPEDGCESCGFGADFEQKSAER